MSNLEGMLAMQMKAIGLPEPVREYRFAPPRRWRIDFAFPEYLIGVEVEGGTWINGRHNRGAGFEADLEKYNTAMMMGWCFARFSGSMIKSGKAVETIEKLIELARERDSSKKEIAIGKHG